MCLGYSQTTFAQKKLSKKKIEALKTEVAQIVESNHKQSQIMVDKIFSFSELGFQEIESSKYLVGILQDNGFEIEKDTPANVAKAVFGGLANGEEDIYPDQMSREIGAVYATNPKQAEIIFSDFVA